MHKKHLLAIALLTAVCAVQAQSTLAKKALVARILKVQEPVIVGTATNLVEQPALQMMQGANAALAQRIAPEKREALAKEIEADIKKYVTGSVPFARDRALKLAPTTVGAVLEEKLSEDELKQVATFLESPAYVKYQQLGGEMQKSLLEKLVADVRPTIEPRVAALDQSIAKRLGVNTGGAAPAAPAK